jgi:hypothetical protein
MVAAMDNEYERAYRDALNVLFRRGRQVGRPHKSKDGTRRCQVDRVSMTDLEALREAWGEALARDILRERDARDNACSECDRLWTRYSELMGRYLTAIRSKLAEAEGGAVQETRNQARKEVLDHLATHPRL